MSIKVSAIKEEEVVFNGSQMSIEPKDSDDGNDTIFPLFHEFGAEDSEKNKNKGAD